MVVEAKGEPGRIGNIAEISAKLQRSEYDVPAGKAAESLAGVVESMRLAQMHGGAINRSTGEAGMPAGKERAATTVALS